MGLEIADHWIETTEGKIFAKSWTPKSLGEKAPIILFHDSLGCVQLWHDFPVALSQATGRKVIAYDRLGFGKSDLRADKLNVGFIAEEADYYFPQLKKHLGIDRFIAFGHSVGGAMAILSASRYVEVCEAVISESAQAFIEERTLAGISVAKKEFEDASRFEKLRKYHGDKARWVLDAWVDTWLSPNFSSWSLNPDLPKLKAPLLVIHGENDAYGSLAFPETISSLTGGKAHKVILSKCGHVPHKEERGLVLKEISEFFQMNLI